MKIRITLAALALIGGASLIAAPGIAQVDAEAAPESGTAWEPASDQPQEGMLEASENITIQWDAPGGVAREPIPLAPRSHNTAFSPTAEQSTER